MIFFEEEERKIVVTREKLGLTMTVHAGRTKGRLERYELNAKDAVMESWGMRCW